MCLEGIYIEICRSNIRTEETREEGGRHTGLLIYHRLLSRVVVAAYIMAMWPTRKSDILSRPNPSSTP